MSCGGRSGPSLSANVLDIIAPSPPVLIQGCHRGLPAAECGLPFRFSDFRFAGKFSKFVPSSSKPWVDSESAFEHRDRDVGCGGRAVCGHGRG